MFENEEIIIENVSPKKLNELRAEFLSNDGTITEGNEGIAENPCFAARFSLEPSREILRLHPLRMVPNLTPTRLKRQVEALLDPPPQSFVRPETGETIYQPTPFSCAVYNWAIGYITNRTDTVLTFSSAPTQHGNFQNYVSPVPAHSGPEARSEGFWRNRATKDSTAGCFGDVLYTLGDGVTTMRIHYGINTNITQSASVGLAGQNASRYTATVTRHHKFSKATNYLYPYVTLDYAR